MTKKHKSQYIDIKIALYMHIFGVYHNYYVILKIIADKIYEYRCILCVVVNNNEILFTVLEQNDPLSPLKEIQPF